MINKKLLDEITEYCKVNNLDISELINKMLTRGFTIEKYGETPIKHEVVIKKETKKVTKVNKVKKVVENPESPKKDLYGE